FAREENGSRLPVTDHGTAGAGAGDDRDLPLEPHRQILEQPRGMLAGFPASDEVDDALAMCHQPISDVRTMAIVGIRLSAHDAARLRGADEPLRCLHEK